MYFTVFSNLLEPTIEVRVCFKIPGPGLPFSVRFGRKRCSASDMALNCKEKVSESASA